VTLKDMPLGTPQDVRRGWAFLNGLTVRRLVETGWVTYRELTEAKDRVILAAIEHGLIDPADGKTWR
jgi:hypothetical protein